jgi:hypothetical protein
MLAAPFTSNRFCGAVVPMPRLAPAMVGLFESQMMKVPSVRHSCPFVSVVTVPTRDYWTTCCACASPLSKRTQPNATNPNRALRSRWRVRREQGRKSERCDAGEGCRNDMGNRKQGVRLINVALLYVMIRVQSFLNTCGCGPRIGAVAKDQHRRLTCPAGDVNQYSPGNSSAVTLGTTPQRSKSCSRG